jgi:hypothetical protein
MVWQHHHFKNKMMIVSLGTRVYALDGFGCLWKEKERRKTGWLFGQSFVAERRL